MNTNHLQGLCAYITGGSSGIGLATAKLLASAGANVIIFARRPDLLGTASIEIEDSRISARQRFSCRPLDVSQRDEVQKVLSAAVSEFGAPDILINSAGVSYPQRFEDIPFDKFDEIIKVNLYGTWNTTDILAPYLKASKGYIVNISSVAGLIGVFGMTAYSASKYAVIGFSEALRSELKPQGVTVSVLCPPEVKTPMLEWSNKIKPEEARAISSAADLMTPEAVAEALVKGMLRGNFLIIPNASAKLAHFIKRLLPGLVEWIIDRKIRGARKS
jgi:3-dehydrosphinganine reductase